MQIKKTKKCSSTIKKEITDQFLDHICDLVDYWEKSSGVTTVRERLIGMSFSILAAIDGDSAALDEGFELTPISYEIDIAGNLHSQFLGRIRK